MSNDAALVLLIGIMCISVGTIFIVSIPVALTVFGVCISVFGMSMAVICHRQKKE